jgi:hypothetical protein
MKDTLLRFFDNDDIKRELRVLIKPISSLIYNELYIYIWFLCVYHVVLLFVIVTVLCLLLQRGGAPAGAPAVASIHMS